MDDDDNDQEHENYPDERELRTNDVQTYKLLEEQGKPIPFSIERQTWYITLPVGSRDNISASQQELIANLRSLRGDGEGGPVFDFETEDDVRTFMSYNRQSESAIFRVEVSNITNGNRDGIEEFIDTVSANVGSVSASYIHFGRSTQAGYWGGGGPGGWPMMPNWFVPDTTFNQPGGYHTFILPTPHVGLGNPNFVQQLQQTGGQNVIVALLDTAPDIAYWEARSTLFKVKNPLIRSLRDAYDNNRFKIFYSMRPSHERFLNGYRIPTYALVDHGIFVAGIVHSIAPQAEIWLYRVINNYGVTYANPVQDAILDLLDELDRQNIRKTVIVNCSFNLVDNAAEAARNIKSQNENIMYDNREDIATEVTRPVLLVGASGNEATFKPIMQAATEPTLQPYLVSTSVADAPPYPRFPAAFETVLGVTALNSQGKRAKYANWADDFDLARDTLSTFDATLADRIGIATYGGDIIELPDPHPNAIGNPLYNLRLSNPFDSILGAYISDFPLPVPEYNSASYVHQQVPNQQGWAYWSGTSFATPIVSALLALIAAQDPTLITEAQLIQRLIDYCGITRLPHTNSNTGAAVPAEHLLNVKQGTLPRPGYFTLST